MVAELQAEVGPTRYARRDIVLRRSVAKAEMVARLAGDAPQRLAGEAVAEVQTLDGVKYILSDESWLLIRPSGTEPVLRVYAEARSAEQVDALLAYGQQVASQ
jgi:phosphomannomutase